MAADQFNLRTRAEAKALGAKRYFTGEPCTAGHVADRSTVNGQCCECSRLSSNARYHGNKEKAAAAHKAWRAKNPDRVAARIEEQRRQKRERNPDLLVRDADRLSREAAAAEGKSMYMAMRACNSGHAPLRFTNGSKCVECNRLSCERRSAAKVGMTPAERKHAAASKRAAREAKDAAKAAKAEQRGARSRAKMAGEEFYVGKPCPKTHDGLRRTKDGSCVACTREAHLAPERLAYQRAYYEKNRDRVLVRCSTYAKANYARLALSAKAWRAKNPDKVRAIRTAYTSRRRTTEKAGDPTSVIWAWEKSAPKVCHWCNVKCKKKYHIDHYQPLAKGGKHEVANLVIACPSCNHRKSAKDPYEFAKERGRLF